jgi:hypothetical protein
MTEHSSSQPLCKCRRFSTEGPKPRSKATVAHLFTKTHPDCFRESEADSIRKSGPQTCRHGTHTTSTAPGVRFFRPLRSCLGFADRVRWRPTMQSKPLPPSFALAGSRNGPAGGKTRSRTEVLVSDTRASASEHRDCREILQAETPRGLAHG